MRGDPIKSVTCLASIGALLLLGACAGGAPAGPLPPTDPAQIEFAPELGIDLADFELTPSGLYVQELNVGTGPTARRTSRVWIYYVGWLPDGTVFDGQLEGDPFHGRLGGRRIALLVCQPRQLQTHKRLRMQEDWNRSRGKIRSV